METAMQTTTFIQVIDGTRYKVSIPLHRVETIINRTDRWIERNKFERAFEVIEPFIINEKKVKTPTKSKMSVKDAIEKFKTQGRRQVIKILVNELGVTKPAAYYHVRKANIL